MNRIRMFRECADALRGPETAQSALAAALPLLILLGDYVGNGPDDPNNPVSLGVRCDAIGRVRKALERMDRRVIAGPCPVHIGGESKCAHCAEVGM